MEEQTDKENKKRSFPAFKFLGCGCLILIFFVIAFFALLFLSFNGRDIVIGFLNASTSPPVLEQNKSIDEIFESINASVSSFGESTIEITEEELSVILKDRIGNTETFVDISDGNILLFWPANLGSEDPLFIVANVIVENSELVLGKLGTPRVGLPKVITKPLSEYAFNLLDAPSQLINKDLISTLLPLNEEIEIKHIEAKENSLFITLDLRADILK